MKTQILSLIISITIMSGTPLIAQDNYKFRNDKGTARDSLLLDIKPVDIHDPDSSTVKQLEQKRKLKSTVKPVMFESSISPSISYYSQVEDPLAKETEQLISVSKSSNRLRSGITSAVGEIKMTSDVSHNGTMVVDVPIEFSKGGGDLIPNISITYNNQGGNSVAGYGWNISGLSAITYRSKSLYYDGIVSPANTGFFADLYWEGKRLVFRGGSMNTTCYYHLEGSEGTITAQRINSNTNNITIYDSQGRSFFYDFIPTNSSFQLKRVTDRFGNYMDYAYYTDQNTSYLSRISYGGNLTKRSTSNKFVYFFYEARHDPIINYNDGKKMVVNQRLKTISTEEKTYTLVYSNNHFSKLSRIECAVKNGTLTQNLEPLYFSYGMYSSGNMNKMEGTMYSYFTDGKHETIEAMTSNMSVDGKEEGVVTYPKKDMYKWGKMSGQNYETAHSMYHPDDVVFVAPTYNDAIDYFGLYKVKCNNGFRTAVTLDADNFPETKETIIINANGGYTGGTQHIQMRVFGYAGLAMYGVIKTVNFYLKSDCSHNSYSSVTQIGYQTGDFKGDGIERIIGVQHDNGGFSLNSVIYLFDIKTSKSYMYYTPFKIAGEDKVIAMDYDNDGKTDLYHFHDNGFDIYSFNLTNPTNPNDLTFTLSKVASSNAVTRHRFDQEDRERTGNIFSARWYARRKVLFGDINGDNKLDVLVTAQYGTKKGVQRSMNGDTWTQVLSAGDGQFDVTQYNMSGIWLNTYRDVFMHDFNGDGRSDVVCIRNGNLQVVHSNGNIIDKNKINSYSMGGLDSEGKLFTIDHNRSNHNRVIGFIRNNKIAKLSIDRNEIVSSYLTSALTSHNVKTEVAYQKINDKSGNYIYNSGYGATFPFENYKGHFWVVSQLKETFNGKTGFRRNYNYENLVMHRQGLGFCGFERISYYDDITGRNNSITYDPYNFSIVKKINASDKTIENTYNISTYGKKEPRIRLISQKITDLATNNIMNISNAYDTYGNATKTVTDYGTGIVEERTVDYYNYLSNYNNTTRIGFPLNITNKMVRGSSNNTTSVHNTYNGKYLLSKVIEKTNGNIRSTKEFEYDAYSNIIKQDYTPYSATDKKLTTTFVYSTDGSKLTRSVNALGQGVDFVYSGNLLTSTKDHKGNTTSYEYDASRRITKQINPDNTVEITTYEYDTYNLYSVVKSKTNQPTSSVQYDGLHREVRNYVQSINSTIYVLTEYDYRSRVSRKSLPHNTTTPMAWSTYSYDNYDRVLQINHASGKKDIYSYSGNTNKVTSENITTTQVNDVLGLVTLSTDEGGTTTYLYRADGQPDKITVPGNAITSFTYDFFGRQITLTDPSGGLYKYEYDNIGNLSKETNPKNGVSLFTYDKHSRIITKVVDGISTTHSYKLLDGYLLSAVSNNGVSVYYEHDNLGRVIKEKNTSNSKWIESNIAYTTGNVSSVTYKSNSTGTGNIATEYFVYKNGHLKQIDLLQNGSNTRKTVWSFETENQIGQVTSIKTGNLTRNFTYNNIGTLTGQSVINGTTMVQNLTYNFDPLTNNLLMRKDTRGFQENLGYDNLNRLTSYREGTISYDTKGNITENRYAKLVYNQPAKPYAANELTYKNTELPIRSQYLEFNNQNRVSKISENGFETTFLYNSNGERVQMTMKKNNAVQYTRFYISPKYELTEGAGAKEVFYIGGDAYSSVLALVKENGTWSLNQICRDYLGSVTHITNETGAVRQELSYDAWGRRRNPTNLQYYADGQEPEPLLGRGYTGHEHLTCFGLINMNARLYEPAMGRFVSPDPFIKDVFSSQDFNRYSYAGNNPFKFIDKNGEIVWWIPVAAGAIVGAYAGASIQSGTWNFTKWESDWWKGAIAGAFVGATAGGLVASAVGASGMTVTVAGKVVGASKAWGLTSTIINSASINIGLSAMSEGGWDSAWKAGIVGAAIGGWTATGGFGMVKAFGKTGSFAKFAGKMGFQAIGTSMGSIGRNWAAGEKPFSKVMVGVGPVNLTLGKGQKLLQWQNNLGTIATYSFGLVNFAFGGKGSWDWSNLSWNFKGGLADKFYDPLSWNSGFGAHAVIGNSNLSEVYGHELTHLWQSRSMGDVFLVNYGLQGLMGALRGTGFMDEGTMNLFESQAYGAEWWPEK